MASYIYICLKLTFSSQLCSKHIVVVLCLKLRHPKNRNCSISLWEEPGKGRACNYGTSPSGGLMSSFCMMVTSLKKNKTEIKSQPNKKTCASCNVGQYLCMEGLGRQLSQFKSFLLYRSDLDASLEPVMVAPSVLQGRLLYQLKTIYFFLLG